MLATSTIEYSLGAAARQWAGAVAAAAADATALNRTIAGLSDGKDYGRYFRAENPLAAYLDVATSLTQMIARGSAWRKKIADLAAAMLADALAAPGAFIAEAMAMPEALRRACAEPADAIRLLAALVSFDAATPFDLPAPAKDEADALSQLTRFRAGIGVAGEALAGWPNWLADPIGAQVAALTAGASVLMRRAAAISLARAAATYPPSSYQDAVRVRNIVDQALDAVIEEAGDRFEDDSYRALSAMRVAVIEDLAARGASLAPIVTRNFGAPLPALVVAHRLYQDATRSGEVLARNDCPHPAFLPVQLEVLAS